MLDAGDETALLIDFNGIGSAAKSARGFQNLGFFGAMPIHFADDFSFSK
jgi:hypothetical protein